MFSCQNNKSVNLTCIKWAHAVNSNRKLEEALKDDIDMLEADIVLGTTEAEGPIIPIMGHPPMTTSDISLLSFLMKTQLFNKSNPHMTKGLKLDFKTIEVFESSLDILENICDKDYPIWLNADIIRGPVNQTSISPVDPIKFFYGCKRFKNAVLSIGWTTFWGKNFKEGYYTDHNINDMIQAIKENNVSQHKITFPVRAGIAANSIQQLHNLVNEINKTNECTLTIWSSIDDYVDVAKLKKLIYSFGLSRVYIDVPKELFEQLNLNADNCT